MLQIGFGGLRGIKYITRGDGLEMWGIEPHAAAGVEPSAAPSHPRSISFFRLFPIGGIVEQPWCLWVNLSNLI